MTFPGLATAVVARIANHVPHGIDLREEPEGRLRLEAGERWDSFPLDEPEVEHEIDPETYDPPFPAFAVLEALDFVQEFVHDDLDPAWEPGEPWAELEDDEIQFGYTGGTSFEPIPLAELSR